MVWSDQSQFPFNVYDNNGKLIFVIDQQGMHIVGPHGQLNGLIDPGTGTAFLQYINDAVPNVAGILYVVSPGISTGLELLTSNIAATATAAHVKITANGRVFLQGGDAVTLNGPIVALDSNTIQMKNDINQPNPVIYDATTKFLGMAGLGWTNCVMFAGWQQVGGHVPFQAKVTPDGTVYFRGKIFGGTFVDGTIIAQTPGGNSWNVSGGLAADLFIGQQGGAPGNPRVEFLGGGNMTVFGVTAGTTHLCFDGLSFSTDHL